MANPDKGIGATSQISGTGCLIRLSWMIFGNVAVVICLVRISGHAGSFFSATDAVFWALIPLLIWLRYVDITRMNGQTACGEPATLSHWRRYAVSLLVFSLVTWAVAHAIA